MGVKKATAATSGAVDVDRALTRAFLANERVNQLLITLLSPAIWRAFPPSSKRRNIATSFAHIHNVRCMRLKMSARNVTAPARLDRAEATPAQASDALAESAGAFVRLIQQALAAGGRVAEYRGDVVLMVCAAINHEAHHRGQICHWARELGAPILPEQQVALWDWETHGRGVTADGFEGKSARMT